MGEAVEEIIGTIVIEGGKYLLKKVVNEIGKAIWQAFADEDGDGVPDDPENPFREYDEEPDDWEPFDPLPENPIVPVDPNPVEPAPQRTITFVVVAPDGTMTVYDESGEITPEDCDYAYSLWVSDNGIMSKKLDNYSVTEGLDYAMDDICRNGETPVITVRKVDNALLKGDYRSRSRDNTADDNPARYRRKNKKMKGKVIRGRTTEVGSRYSECMCRFYDKLAESIQKG